MRNQTDPLGLTDMAAQTLSVIAPYVSRLVRPVVHLVDQAETASTDGLFIIMPRKFVGVDILEDKEAALGLIAHECGHFFQPLKEMQKAEEDTHAPHWLANVLLDIHAEYNIERVFPPLSWPLEATHRLVSAVMKRKYETQCRRAKSFPELALSAMLYLRFCVRDARPDNLAAAATAERLLPKKCGSGGANEALLKAKAGELASYLFGVFSAEARELPKRLKDIMKAFPELAGTSPKCDFGDFGDACAGPRIGGRLVDAIRREALNLHSTGRSSSIRRLRCHAVDPEPEAAKCAAMIQLHLAHGADGIRILTPDRIDRREAAAGHPAPFYGIVPGGTEVPKLSVLVCLDVSNSMDRPKRSAARIAAQAVALAVQAEGGDVRALLFGMTGYNSGREYGPEILFSSGHPHDDETTFGWLPEAWTAFPRHQVLLVTDGMANPPPFNLEQRERTIALLLPNCDDHVQMARKSIVLRSVKDLPYVLGMLLPRARVA
ncbi:MAG: hypothetical protein WBM17_04400 [Anaerolineales bacterium]